MVFHKRRMNKRKHKNKSSYFTVKTALTKEQEVKQAQAQRSKLFLFLVQFNIFLVKTEHVVKARDVSELFFFYQL